MANKQEGNSLLQTANIQAGKSMSGFVCPPIQGTGEIIQTNTVIISRL